jgi:hypothetical protein
MKDNRKEDIITRASFSGNAPGPLTIFSNGKVYAIITPSGARSVFDLTDCHFASDPAAAICDFFRRPSTLVAHHAEV